jgi:hypothetical protein
MSEPFSVMDIRMDASVEALTEMAEYSTADAVRAVYDHNGGAWNTGEPEWAALIAQYEAEREAG